MKILIASHNQGKIREFESMFSDLDIQVESLLDYPDIEEVEETGETFEANARLKAESIAKLTGKLCLADDSGLVVDALDGAPGVYSARYSGEPKDDDRNNMKLLADLKAVPWEARTAHFHSTIVVAYPGYDSLVVEGQVEGYILHELDGEQGFGYDPLFYYPELDKSFGQIPIQDKNKISHRAKALKQLVKELPGWLESVKANEIFSNE